MCWILFVVCTVSHNPVLCCRSSVFSFFKAANQTFCWVFKSLLMCSVSAHFLCLCRFCKMHVWVRNAVGDCLSKTGVLPLHTTVLGLNKGWESLICLTARPFQEFSLWSVNEACEDPVWCLMVLWCFPLYDHDVILHDFTSVAAAQLPHDLWPQRSWCICASMEHTADLKKYSSREMKNVFLTLLDHFPGHIVHF